jgi:hypothetical protein
MASYDVASSICQALVTVTVAKIQALHDELLVLSGGPEDPLEPGRSLHVDGFGGRTERHLAGGVLRTSTRTTLNPFLLLRATVSSY